MILEDQILYNNHENEIEPISFMFEESGKSFESLILWQKSHSFVLSVYSISRSFPKEEIYGLTSQLRRAAISIPANIAEGYGRYSLAEKVRFYNIAQSSLNEVKYYLILVNDLKYADVKELTHTAEEISKILDAYIKKIKEHL